MVAVVARDGHSVTRGTPLGLCPQWRYPQMDRGKWGRNMSTWETGTWMGGTLGTGGRRVEDTRRRR